MNPGDSSTQQVTTAATSFSARPTSSALSAVLLAEESKGSTYSLLSGNATANQEENVTERDRADVIAANGNGNSNGAPLHQQVEQLPHPNQPMHQDASRKVERSEDDTIDDDDRNGSDTSENDNDRGNNPYWSEPSISEDDPSRVRAPHRLSSSPLMIHGGRTYSNTDGQQRDAPNTRRNTTTSKSPANIVVTSHNETALDVETDRPNISTNTKPPTGAGPLQLSSSSSSSYLAHPHHQQQPPRSSRSPPTSTGQLPPQHHYPPPPHGTGSWSGMQHPYLGHQSSSSLPNNSSSVPGSPAGNTSLSSFDSPWHQQNHQVVLQWPVPEKRKRPLPLSGGSVGASGPQLNTATDRATVQNVGGTIRKGIRHPNCRVTGQSSQEDDDDEGNNNKVSETENSGDYDDDDDDQQGLAHVHDVPEPSDVSLSLSLASASSMPGNNIPFPAWPVLGQHGPLMPVYYDSSLRRQSAQPSTRSNGVPHKSKSHSVNDTDHTMINSLLLPGTVLPPSLHTTINYNERNGVATNSRQRRASMYEMGQLVNVPKPLDESIVMNLSDSDGEGDASSMPRQQQHRLLDTSNPSLARTEDWEEHADDERTANQDFRHMQQQLRGGSGRLSSSNNNNMNHPQHHSYYQHNQHPHRQRSGDAAAASLVVGGIHWRGMTQDHIPIPGQYDVDDEEDDSPSNSGGGLDRFQMSQSLPVNHMRQYYHGFGRSHSDKSLGGNEGTHLGDDSGHALSSSFGSYEGLPHYHYSAQYRRGPPPPPPLHDKMDDSQQVWRAHMNRLYHTSSSDSPRINRACSSDASAPPGHNSLSRLAETDQEDDASSSAGSDETAVDETDDDHDDDEDGCDSVSANQMQGGRITLSTLPDAEQKFEDRQFRGVNQGMMRQRTPRSESPFANFDKASPEKFKRSFFAPSYVNIDSGKCRTYTCPKCHTIQREFFSIDDAPSSGQGPSAYLALYFGSYLLCSLFLFGLQEGWHPLDCVYFAVITLTTAGLGDFVPTTDPSKIMCSIFIYFGVACIGLFLGTYIAGMMDAKALVDRKSKMIESCPNCAHLRILHEREEELEFEISPEFPAGPLKKSQRSEGLQRNQFHSERVHHTDVFHQSFRRSHHYPSPVSGSGPTPRNPSPDSLPRSEAISSTSMVSQSRGYHKQIDTYGSLAVGQGQFPVINNTHSTEASGSSTTHEILQRQKHSRHASMIPQHSPGSPTPKSLRKYSADYSKLQAPLITRAMLDDYVPTSAPATDHQRPKLFGSQHHHHHALQLSDDSDSVSVSKSKLSESSEDQYFNEKHDGMRDAKYVILTLRQALMNSLIIIAAGCLGFHFIEGFSLVDSWYFTTVLLTTVGYGDIHPVTKGGKLFATVYILVAGSILLNNMASIANIPLTLRQQHLEKDVLTQFGDQLDDAALRELATGPVVQRLHLTAKRSDGLAECTREMFALAMLVRMGKVNEEDVKHTFTAFRKLDVNNEGVLNSGTIIAGMVHKVKSIRSHSKVICTAEIAPAPRLFGQQETSDDTASSNNNMIHEHDEPMKDWWVGLTGSLHVKTPDDAIHFQPNNNNNNTSSGQEESGSTTNPLDDDDDEDDDDNSESSFLLHQHQQHNQQQSPRLIQQ